LQQAEEERSIPSAEFLLSLEKENERLSLEIKKVNEILRSMSKEAQVEFFKVKKEVERENIENSREKNKLYEMRL